MDPSPLENPTIEQLLDALEMKVESTFRNPFSYSTDKAEWAEVNRYMEKTARILVRIKNRHNAFNPIHQLPREIFHQVFEQMQWNEKREPLHPRFPYLREAQDHTRWLVVTKVCRYWRAISFSFPSLWCDIFIDPELERSHSINSWFMERSAPMSFRVSQDRWIGYPIVDDTAMAMNRSALTGLCNSLSSSCSSNRLKSIFLQFDQGSQDTIVKLLDLPLPSLVNLSLFYRSQTRTRALLPQVFHGQASRVGQLYLIDAWCWPANMETFKNLTHFVGWTSESTATTMLEVLIMLKACPHLEILHLRYIHLADADVIIPTHLSGLPSPRLKSLLLETYGGVQQLLRHLELSPTTSIFATFTDDISCGFTRLEIFDTARGADFKYQVTTLEIRFGTQESVCLHQNQLVISVRSSFMDTLSSLRGRFPVLREIGFSLTHKDWLWRNPLTFEKGEAVSVCEQFLNGIPTLETIHFKTPGFEDARAPLMNAISRSSTLIEELRITHVSSQAECVEVVERGLSPSYRLVTEPRVPIADTPPSMAGLELSDFLETDIYDDF